MVVGDQRMDWKTSGAVLRHSRFLRIPGFGRSLEAWRIVASRAKLNPLECIMKTSAEQA